MPRRAPPNLERFPKLTPENQEISLISPFSLFPLRLRRHDPPPPPPAPAAGAAPLPGAAWCVCTPGRGAGFGTVSGAGGRAAAVRRRAPGKLPRLDGGVLAPRGGACLRALAPAVSGCLVGGKISSFSGRAKPNRAVRRTVLVDLTLARAFRCSCREIPVLFILLDRCCIAISVSED